MTTPEDARNRVVASLREHFGTSDTPLSPEEVSKLTGIDLPLVQRSLQILHEMQMVEGITVAEINYPLRITKVAW